MIVSGYGSSGDDSQWTDLMNGVREHSGEYGHNGPWYWAPSGHFLEDYEAPLDAALNKVAEAGASEVIILPLYMAISSYQRKLIPKVIAGHEKKLKIHFQPDAILPCQEIVRWGAERIQECLDLMEHQGSREP